jgi:hypothetical protein
VVTVWLTISLATVAAIAGFLASALPGIGLTPLLQARFRLAEAATPTEKTLALMGVMLTALLVSLSGVLRLVMFVVGVLAIVTELLAERVSDKSLSTTTPTSEEIEDGR